MTKSEAMRVCSPGQPCSHVAKKTGFAIKNWWLYQGLSKNILISNIRRFSWFNRFHLVRHFVFSSDQVVLPNIFSADVIILREAFQHCFVSPRYQRRINASKVRDPKERDPHISQKKIRRIKHQKPMDRGTYGQHQLTTGRMFSGHGR